ncbi:MAG: porin family protein [Niabella sp.]
MKVFRTVSLGIISLLIIQSAQAQFHIGIKAGTNIGKIDGKSFDKEFDYSYLVGGFAEIGINDRFSINPEVLFSQTSTTRSDDLGSPYKDLFNNDQKKAKLNYLSIPILANVKLAGPLHIEAGPQYSILMNKNEDLLHNGENAFKKGDFSLVGGVQVKLNSFRVTGRYVVGLNNINDIGNQDKWRNEAVQVSLGLAF